MASRGIVTFTLAYASYRGVRSPGASRRCTVTHSVTHHCCVCTYATIHEILRSVPSFFCDSRSPRKRPPPRRGAGQSLRMEGQLLFLKEYGVVEPTLFRFLPCERCTTRTSRYRKAPVHVRVVLFERFVIRRFYRTVYRYTNDSIDTRFCTTSEFMKISRSFFGNRILVVYCVRSDRNTSSFSSKQRDENETIHRGIEERSSYIENLKRYSMIMYTRICIDGNI